MQWEIKDSHNTFSMDAVKVVELLLRHASEKKEEHEEHIKLIEALCSFKTVTEILVDKGLKEMLVIVFNLGFYYNKLKTKYETKVTKYSA